MFLGNFLGNTWVGSFNLSHERGLKVKWGASQSIIVPLEEPRQYRKMVLAGVIRIFYP